MATESPVFCSLDFFHDFYFAACAHERCSKPSLHPHLLIMLIMVEN